MKQRIRTETNFYFMSNKLDKIIEYDYDKKKEINDNFYLKDWQIDKFDWEIFMEYFKYLVFFFALIYKIIIIFSFFILY